MALRKPVVSNPEAGNPTTALAQLPTGDMIAGSDVDLSSAVHNTLGGLEGAGPEFFHLTLAEITAVLAHLIDTGNPHAVTAAQAGAAPIAHVGAGGIAEHPIFTAGTEGFVPAPGAPAGLFLKDDGTWAAAGGGGGLPGRVFEADQLESPNNADWAINALAPLTVDSNNAGLNIRLFDDTIEEGVGFKVQVPSGAANIVISLVSRAETAPGAARTVGLRIYEREIPDNAAPTVWSAGTAMADIDIPTNENFQYDSETFTLAALGLTAGSWHQFELTRINPTAGTELVGDWTLLTLKVDFT